jgi:hypothetical protein
MYYGLKKRNSDTSYDFYIETLFKNYITYENNIYSAKGIVKSLIAGGMIERDISKSIPFILKILKSILPTIPIDIICKKYNIISSIEIDGCVKKDVMKTWLSDGLLSRSKRRSSLMGINIVSE